MPAEGEFSDADDFWTFESEMRSTLFKRQWKNATIPDYEEDQLVAELDPWLSRDNWVTDDRDHPTLDDIHNHGYVSSDSANHEDFQRDVLDFWYNVRAFFEPQLEWGFWRSGIIQLFTSATDDEPELPIGYGRGSSLKLSHHHTNASVIQHIYTEAPEPVNWILHPEVINPGSNLGLVAYVAVGKFSEIEAITKVPWMDPGLTSEQFANYVRTDRMREQWQRKIDSERIRAIQNFASDISNTMFNPIILYITKEDIGRYVIIDQDDDGNRTITINFDFLAETFDGNLTDYVFRPNEDDKRPIWLVDGQHRTRGFGASHRGSEMSVPIVLLMDDDAFDGDTRKLIARVFTEINTGADPLEKLHKLFLKYQFEMDSSNHKDNWVDFNNDDAELPIDAEKHYNHARPIYGSRSNRRSYEAALYLACQENSPLRNCIQFQKPAGQRRLHHIVINTHSWCETVRPLFQPGNIYGGTDESKPPYSDELNSEFEIIDTYCDEEMKNYLNAFVSVCQQNRPNMWVTGIKSNKQLFQNEGPFPVLMQVLPFVLKKIIRESDEDIDRPVSREQFHEELLPLVNVDWKAPTVKGNLGGRTNTNRKHLAEWIMRAIIDGGVHEPEDILSSELHGQPGKGLLSPPPTACGLQQSVASWPRLDSPLQIRMEKPPHALLPIWEVEIVRNGETHNLPKSPEGYKLTPIVDWIIDNVPTESPAYSQITIPENAVRGDVSEIRVTGSWKNNVGQGGKFEELSFTPSE